MHHNAPTKMTVAGGVTWHAHHGLLERLQWQQIKTYLEALHRTRLRPKVHLPGTVTPRGMSPPAM